MTREEYKNCERAAKMYHDKVRECELLRLRLEQKERENKLLREQLGYKRASDIQYSKEDEELFVILNSRENVEESRFVFFER